MAPWRLCYILAFASVPPAAGAYLAWLASCSGEAEPVATIQPSDPLQVRHSMGGETQRCHAVSLTVDGKAVKGSWSAGEAVRFGIT